MATILEITTTNNRAFERALDLEIRRLRMRDVLIKDVCNAADIKPEMYSYLQRRGRDGHSLPANCLDKIEKALDKLERDHQAKANRKRKAG